MVRCTMPLWCSTWGKGDTVLRHEALRLHQVAGCLRWWMSRRSDMLYCLPAPIISVMCRVNMVISQCSSWKNIKLISEKVRYKVPELWQTNHGVQASRLSVTNAVHVKQSWTAVCRLLPRPGLKKNSFKSGILDINEEYVMVEQEDCQGHLLKLNHSFSPRSIL